MDRVNIVTLQGRWNYGNRLQNYATSKIYESLGFEVKSLIFKDTRRRIKAMIKRACGMSRNDPEKLMSPDRRVAFERFDELMDFECVSSFERIGGDGAWYSVGSDQVWSTAYAPRLDRWYFLDAVPKEKRIALAPSIGLDLLDTEQMKRLAQGVSGFESLSIREGRGAEIIKEASGRCATVICDPTIALPREEWAKVSDDSLTPVHEYVFTYILGDGGEDKEAVLSEVTEGGMIRVVSLSDHQQPGEPPAGPAEFISLIASARHVVTDSYHAAVFATIFQTPLTIIRRSGGLSMFSRLESLAQTLGIGQKVYGTSEFDLNLAGDFEGVSDAIVHERAKFMAYLEACLNA